MSEFLPEDPQSTQALRDGLAAQPVPTISSDFDARILTALRQETPWPRRLWPALRPVVFGAASSMALTFALLHWTLSLPAQSVPSPVPVAASTPSPLPSVEELLDRPGFGARSLLTAQRHPPPAPPERGIRPRRRAGIPSPLS